jgi:HemY protein
VSLAGFFADESAGQRTLQRLAQELWGKAQSYLEASLSEEPSRSAHVALAQLFDRIGRPEDASRHYRASADAKLRQ